MSRMRSPCHSCEPCEKFSRATSIPAWASCRNCSGAAEAGPMVQTILVRLTSPPASASRLRIGAHLRFNALAQLHELDGVLFQRDILGCLGHPAWHLGWLAGAVERDENNNAMRGVGIDPVFGI